MEEQKKAWDREYALNKVKWKKETLLKKGYFFGKMVLELGVGNGKTLKSIMRDDPKKVYAIDYSSESIKYCMQTFKEKNVTFKVMDFRKMEFENEMFDVVVCYYVLDNMLSEERKDAAKEIIRVLKKGGTLLFEDFHKGDFRQKGKEYMEKDSIEKKSGIMCHFFTKKEVMEIFDGLKMKEMKVNIRSPIKLQKKIERKTISSVFNK